MLHVGSQLCFFTLTQSVCFVRPLHCVTREQKLRSLGCRNRCSKEARACEKRKGWFVFPLPVDKPTDCTTASCCFSLLKQVSFLQNQRVRDSLIMSHKFCTIILSDYLHADMEKCRFHALCGVKTAFWEI